MITNWQPDQISVVVPPNAMHGCVWIHDAAAEQQYRDCVASGQKTFASKAGTTVDALSPAILALLFRARTEPPAVCSPPTHFEGSLPAIEDLRVNGEIGLIATRMTPEIPVRTWNGRDLTITFQVYAAEELKILLRKRDGTLLVETDLSPTATAYTYRVNFTEPTLLVIEVRAQNHCMVQYSVVPVWVSARVPVLVQMAPSIHIAGVEFTQAMQRFSLAQGSTSNNSVALIRRRTTLVRVYVDSGINAGADRTIRVKGSLTVASRTLQAENNQTFFA